MADTHVIKARKKPFRVSKVLLYAALIFVSIVNLFPFYWLLRSSFMTRAEIFSMPMRWFPERIRYENYREALLSAPFLQFFKNSLFLVIVNIIGKLISSSLAAYGFARIDFRGRNVLFGIVMITMMIPGTVMLIPQFIMWSKAGLYDTYWPLTLPSFFIDAFFIFLLKQFFGTLPMTYDEAATIDGASYLQILCRILVPLCKPALMTVAVFTFMGTWNDFMGPLIYLHSKEKYTVSLGLQVFTTEFSTDWHLMMAAATVAVIPMIIIFFFAQRYFIQGITFTGLKG
jgi:multiple sugar transport system permease protein